jgi:hypothetical protein
LNIDEIARVKIDICECTDLELIDILKKRGSQITPETGNRIVIELLERLIRKTSDKKINECDH